LERIKKASNLCVGVKGENHIKTKKKEFRGLSDRERKAS